MPFQCQSAACPGALRGGSAEVAMRSPAEVPKTTAAQSPGVVARRGQGRAPRGPGQAHPASLSSESTQAGLSSSLFSAAHRQREPPTIRVGKTPLPISGQRRRQTLSRRRVCRSAGPRWPRTGAHAAGGSPGRSTEPLPSAVAAASSLRCTDAPRARAAYALCGWLAHSALL
jgi:hypothetical protein